jgi:general secretion pathway protein F
MPRFDYVAIDEGGRTRTGAVNAANEMAAGAVLARRHLAPVKLSHAESGTTEPMRPGRRTSERISANQLALVTRQLATLIAVSPLEEALRTLSMQSDRPAVRRLLQATHASVLEGWRLSEAMNRQGHAFPPLYRAMVAAGESSGSLPEILERLADLLEREQQTRNKVTTALVYPAALAVTATVVVIALMTFVVPKVVDQFASMGQTLPLLTQIVIGVSNLLRGWGWLIGLVLAIGVVLFVRGLKNEGFRMGVDRRLLAIPLIGRLIRDVHAARLARTLSTMISSGLPVMEGLVLTARTVQNRVLRAATEDMATAIREGGGLSAAMKRSGVLPAILVHMTASGENASRLDVMLARAADYLEREFNTVTSVALSLLEPLIIVIMGAVVATIVLSILLPILQINSMVGQ